MMNNNFDILEFEEFLRIKELEKIKSIRLNKLKRRYKQYLNIDYNEPFAMTSKTSLELNKDIKIIELMIKNKYLERKLLKIERKNRIDFINFHSKGIVELRRIYGQKLKTEQEYKNLKSNSNKGE